MSPLHVLVDKGNGKNEIDIESVDDVSDHTNCNGQRCVLKVCQLDVHGSEFYTPANVGVFSRRVLESERVPVCRLKVFEMGIAIDGRTFQEPGSADSIQVRPLYVAQVR